MSVFKMCKHDITSIPQRFFDKLELGDEIEIVPPEQCQYGGHGEVSKWQVKIYPVKLRFDLRQYFTDSGLTKDVVLRLLKFGDGVTAEVGEPEYEVA